jgi:hypothetical protein
VVIPRPGCFTPVIRWIRGMVSPRTGLDMVSEIKIPPLVGNRNPVASHKPITLLAELSLFIAVRFCSQNVFEKESTKTTLYYIYATDTNVGPSSHMC